MGINLPNESSKGTFAFIDAMSDPYSWAASSSSDSSGRSTVFQFSAPISITSSPSLTSQQQSETLPHFQHFSLDSNAAIHHSTNPMSSLWDCIMSSFGSDDGSAPPDCIIIDHINPLLDHQMENAGNASCNCIDSIREFMSSLHALSKSNNRTAVIVLAHADCFGPASSHRRILAATEDSESGIPAEGGDRHDIEAGMLLRELAHRADILIDVDGLPTGYSRDVHGQAIITFMKGKNALLPTTQILHFKAYEHQVKFFAPGSHHSTA